MSNGSGSMTPVSSAAADWLEQADLTAYYGTTRITQLADDDADGAIDSAVMTKVLNGAMAEVESRIAQLYTIPTSEPDDGWPEALVRMGAKVALKILLERRPGKRDDAEYQELADEIDAEYKDLIEGKRRVQGLTTIDPTTSSSGRNTDWEPVFNKDSDGDDGLEKW